MGLATVITDIAPLYERPTAESVRADEVLYGMSAQVIEQNDKGWSYLRTEYGAEGYAPTSFLLTDGEVAASWRKYRKMTVLSPYIDVQLKPHGASPRVASMTRGGILVPLSSPSENGWLKVGMADGSVGYTRASYLGDVISDWKQLSEDDMRWNIVETALSYNGTSFRAGGRTPLGIDSIGLAAMSYLMNGVFIARVPFIKPGGPLHPIRIEQMDEGDVIYFRDTVGIYMGDDKFVHSTEQGGLEGVFVGSMNHKDPEYREDLARHIVAVGSVY